VAAHPLRSILAVAGIVIGIVTVVLVASVLANVRNSVALLFRELGTDNVFAYHRSGDPYSLPRRARPAPAPDAGLRRRDRPRAGTCATWACSSSCRRS